MSPLIRRRFSGHIFGGILYLRQRGRKEPMITKLLANDVLKECLLRVVTIVPGSCSRGSSEHEELCFDYTRASKLSRRNISAWAIIDKVYQQVECKDLIVDVVAPELETTAWKGLGSKKKGKSRGTCFLPSSFNRYFNRRNIS